MSQYRVIQFAVNIIPSISAAPVFEAADDDVALIKAYNHVVSSRIADAEQSSSDDSLPELYHQYYRAILQSEYQSMFRIGLDKELIEEAEGFMKCKLNVVKTFSVAMTLEELTMNAKLPALHFMLEKVE